MTTTVRTFVACATLILSAACGGGPPAPAALEAGTDTCVQCRMVVSDGRFAAQLTAPGTETLFFDDIGCLAEYLARHTRLPPRAMAYVADHRTAEWIPAAGALYTRNLQVTTPMGSHVVAHADLQSQQADPAARAGARVTARELFLLDLPDGTR